MISIYNKAIVKELNPYLWEQLENISEEDINRVKIVSSISGEPTMVYQKEGEDFYLHSRYQPSYEAQKLIDSCEDIKDGDNIIFFGIGLGYHVKEVLRRFPNVRYIIIEPDLNVLYRFLQNNELSDMQLTQLVGIYVDTKKETDVLISFISKKVRIVWPKNYLSVFEQEIKTLNQELLVSLKKERDIATFLSIAQIRTVETEIKNISEVIKTRYLFDCDLNAFKGKAALLVAAGPSLDDEIENIRIIKEKGLAYIFAVGSAVNALIKKGIHADAVFSYDPTIQNQRVFQLIKEQGIKDITLIYGAGIGYESLEDYPGQKLFVINAGNYIANFFVRLKDKSVQYVAEGATISVMALDCLLKMGFSDIIFVGQNLSIRGTQVYSQDMYIMDEGMDNQFSEFREDVNGNLVRTSSVYIMMKENIEAVTMGAENTTIWNATKDGLAIQGTTYRQLYELMEEMKENVVIDNWDKSSEGSKIDINHLSEAKNEMSRLEKDMERQIVLFENTIEDIVKKGSLRLFRQLPSLYKKLNLILTRMENNKYSSLMVMPALFQQYQNLVLKIDELNSIKDPEVQYKAIFKEFNEFLDIYKRTFIFIKEKYDNLKCELDEYLSAFEENEYGINN